MGKINVTLALLILSLCLNIQIISQDTWLQIGESRVNTTGEMHEYPTLQIELQNTDQWIQAKKVVAQRKEEYLKNGWINPAKAHPKFIIPVKAKDGFNDPGYYTITSYYDHDTLYPGHLLDYTCSNLTYDLESGYNHKGTDFFPWPYPWQKMANNEVEVVAAASGMVLLKQNGNYDQQCEETSDPWNGVCILHEDGSTSWYIHLKKNSLTNIGVGQNISQGDYLGIVGSSGSSLAPHLHFEVLDADLKKIDPFTGTCNDGTTDSWWEEQLPYKKPRVNKISAHAHLPVFPGCPEEEIPNESEIFYPGDSIFLMSYFTNISTGDTAEVTIRRPDNSVFIDWIWINPYNFYTASWMYFLMFINDDHYGIWNYQIKYKEVFYNDSFELKDPLGITKQRFTDQLKVYPNPCANIVNIETAMFPGSNSIIKIYNHVGQIIQYIETGADPNRVFQIDLSGYPCGIYFVSKNSGTMTQFKTIIKK